MNNAVQRSVAVPDRLDAVARTGLGPRSDDVLDRYAGLTRRLLDVPVALVSLVGADSQLFPGMSGLPDDVREMSLDGCCCQLVVETGQPLVVTDSDETVDGQPDVRAYVGVPLDDGQGHVLGALCALDRRRRDWSDDELDTLHDLAAAVSSELRLRLTVNRLTSAQLASEASRMLAESAETRAVDAQRSADQARGRAERSAAQLTVLAEVGRALSSTLDPAEAAVRLARCVTPAVCDWCLVMLPGEDGGPPDIGWAHRDPDQDGDVRLVAQADLTAPSTAFGRVLESGQGEFLHRPGDLGLVQGAARAALERLAVTSVAILPLPARGTVFGAIALFTGPDRGRLSETQRADVAEVVRRASQAIDNARLFARQRRVAETLQHSLLSNPPASAGTEVVARYRAATVDAQIGGDWYDAFVLPDGAMVLVVGDVVGHDLTAAAAMGQIRSLVRGIAYDRGESPAEVLTRVDRAMAGLGLDTLATIVIVRLAPIPPGGGDRMVRWASAGHPPPIVTGSDGTIVELEATADLLLGVRPGTARHNHEVPLPLGGVLMLYTDGLIERRNTDLDGARMLLSTNLAELHGLPLAGLCDGLLHRLLPRHHDDDAALIAVRTVATATNSG